MEHYPSHKKVRIPRADEHFCAVWLHRRIKFAGARYQLALRQTFVLENSRASCPLEAYIVSVH